jgi:lysine biosynthesis protein LysW
MTMMTKRSESDALGELVSPCQMEGSEMAGAYCPECDGLITISNPQLGAMVTCRCCNVKLEVYDTDPLDVYYPFDEIWADEDWDADPDEEDHTQ